ncbi:MAG: DUF4430 domain-containing protein [Candidatus Paceibacterota bacterium]
MSKNKKILTIITFLAFFTLLGVFFLILYTPTKENEVQNIENIEITKENEVSNKIVKTFLEINGQRYEGVITEGMSVYDFMDKLRQEGKINFTDKNYIGMGKFIETINGIKNSGGQNWIYYVNEKKAQIGVSNYKLNPGDVVSWKYEKENY